jgi:hypothetical protein
MDEKDPKQYILFRRGCNLESLRGLRKCFCVHEECEEIIDVKKRIASGMARVGHGRPAQVRHMAFL